LNDPRFLSALDGFSAMYSSPSNRPLGTSSGSSDHRDATMVLIAFRHGLRGSELVDLRWEQIDLEYALLHKPVDARTAAQPPTH
jgi:integrase